MRLCCPWGPADRGVGDRLGVPRTSLNLIKFSNFAWPAIATVVGLTVVTVLALSVGDGRALRRPGAPGRMAWPVATLLLCETVVLLVTGMTVWSSSGQALTPAASDRTLAELVGTSVVGIGTPQCILGDPRPPPRGQHRLRNRRVQPLTIPSCPSVTSRHGRPRQGSAGRSANRSSLRSAFGILTGRDYHDPGRLRWERLRRGPSRKSRSDVAPSSSRRSATRSSIDIRRRPVTLTPTNHDGSPPGPDAPRHAGSPCFAPLPALGR